MSKRPGLPVLIAISALNPLALNILQPVLPALAVMFATDYGTAQLTLSAYLFSFALAQLVLGPLSDHFGRRPVVLGGFLLFIAGTFACLFATSMGALIAGRVLQAAGGCAGFVLARAIVRDMHGRDKAASLLGAITSVMVIAPMLAPAIGGFVADYAGWQGVFVTLGIVGAATMVFAWMRLYETRPDMTAEMRPPLFGSMVTLMREPLFLLHTATLAFTSATFFSFLSGAPYVVVTLQGKPPSTYGFYFVTNSLGYMVGSAFMARYAERLGIARSISWGAILCTVAALFMAVFYSLLPLSPLALFVPMTFISAGHGLVLPGATAAAVSVRPDLAGAAAGLSGALQLGISAALAWLVGHFMSDTAWPMIATMLTAVLLALVFARISFRVALRCARSS